MNVFKSAVNRAKKISYLLRGFGSNGRSLNVHPDDVYLVGYPKSGNTWLNFMVACLRAARPEDVDFETVEQHFVADIYFNDAQVLSGLARPRYLKSHESYDVRYPKVVYIVRDPRAVAVSYYHHSIGLQNIGEDYPLEKFVNSFMHGGCDGYGTWKEHVRGWLDAGRRNEERILIVRYEDLKLDTERELAKIAAFLCIDANEDKIRAAVMWARPGNMRKLESATRMLESPVFSNFKGDRFFVRNATSDGWKQELDDESRQRVEADWGDVMRELGYMDNAPLIK